VAFAWVEQLLQLVDRAKEQRAEHLQKRGCTLLVCGLNSQPGSLLYRSGFIDHLGDDNVCPDLSSALQRAYILLPNLMGGFEEDY
jgi:SulP family sulfate permease